MSFSLSQNKIGSIIASYKWIFAIFILRLLLDISYISYIHPVYSHAGFDLLFDPFMYALSFLAVFVLFYMIPLQPTKVSDIIVQFFFITIFIPFTSYFSLSGESFTWFLIFCFFWFFVAAINRIDFGWKALKPEKSISELDFRNRVHKAVLIVFGLIFIFSDLKFNFNIMDVYELREENPTGSVPFSGYIINWTSKVLLPFLLAFAVVKNKNYLNPSSLYILCLILLLFSVTGHKGYLFVAPAIFGTIWLLSTKNFFFNLLLVFIAICGVGLLLFYLFDNKLILTLFIRRTLFIPAQLSFYYYDFFQDNPIYLSNSVFRYFFDYPYELEPPYLIAQHYFNKPEMSSNNGIIADGFMHFGMVGVFIWAMLFSFLLKVLNVITINKNKLILWSLILISSRVFSDGSFFTGLLTHGFLLLILIVYFYPVSKANK